MRGYSESKEVMQRHLRVVEEPSDEARPTKRGDCVNGPRPCPWLSCRHHLAIEVDSHNGTLKFNHPEAAEGDLDQHPHTCSLDVADKGESTLHEVGQHLDLTRERVRQIEEATLTHAQRKMARYR